MGWCRYCGLQVTENIKQKKPHVQGPCGPKEAVREVQGMSRVDEAGIGGEKAGTKGEQRTGFLCPGCDFACTDPAGMGSILGKESILCLERWCCQQHGTSGRVTGLGQEGHLQAVGRTWAGSAGVWIGVIQPKVREGCTTARNQQGAALAGAWAPCVGMLQPEPPARDQGPSRDNGLLFFFWGG